MAVGKSPLTGGWGDANSGGNFGPQLKYAGYDGVFFTGISDKPVYLLIDSGKAELQDAAGVWGKDTFETEDIFRAEYGKDAEIACIGPAGEKVSLIAAIMNNKGRAAGRSGLGAVRAPRGSRPWWRRADEGAPVRRREGQGAAQEVPGNWAATSACSAISAPRASSTYSPRPATPPPRTGRARQWWTCRISRISGSTR